MMVNFVGDLVVAPVVSGLILAANSTSGQIKITIIHTSIEYTARYPLSHYIF